MGRECDIKMTTLSISVILDPETMAGGSIRSVWNTDMGKYPFKLILINELYERMENIPPEIHETDG